MYDFFQRVCASISSLIWNPSVETKSFNKRRRDQIVDITDDDDDDDVIFLSYKKLKLHNEHSSEKSKCLVKNAVTQTGDETRKRSFKHHPWKFVDLSTKENWGKPLEVIDVDDTCNKLRNQYRPPSHVRSPHRIRRKPFSNTQKTNCLNNGVTNLSMDSKAVSSKGETLNQKGMDWTALSRLSRTGSSGVNHKTSNGFDHSNISQKEIAAISHDAYSKLLNSYIKKDFKPIATSPGPYSIIDLTNEDVPVEKQNNSGKSHLKLFDNLELPTNRTMFNSSQNTHLPSVRRVKPKPARAEFSKYKTRHIISIDSEDEDDDDCVEIIKTPPVPKMNSLQDKIKAMSLAADTDWVTDTKLKLTEITTRLTLDLKVISEKNSNNLNDRVSKLLSRHLEVTEFVPIEEEPALPQLTSEMLEVVDRASAKQPANEVLVVKFNYNLKRSDINTLTGLNWLNDEVINFYMTLITERSKDNKSLPKTYCFSTFFYLKLATSGHQGVKRWTKKVDLFDHDLIIIPVHLKMHWCLAAVDRTNKSINYYDSMGTKNDQCLKRLEDYLVDEFKDKKGQVLAMDDWTKNNVQEIPRQMNGSDCGVFSCTFAEFLSRRSKFAFEQKDMPYIRQKMIYEIVTGQLLR